MTSRRPALASRTRARPCDRPTIPSRARRSERPSGRSWRSRILPPSARPAGSSSNRPTSPVSRCADRPTDPRQQGAGRDRRGTAIAIALQQQVADHIDPPIDQLRHGHPVGGRSTPPVATVATRTAGGRRRSAHGARPAGPPRRSWLQRIADAPHRLDRIAAARLGQLHAQAADIDVDDIGLRLEFIAPDTLDQHRAGQHLAGMPRQFGQQLEFQIGERDRLACSPRESWSG
ncbi:unnamed protein product [Acanthosepion pharaonis]|uniref:Uncharacterized protein n=1 Tax=Acanthosepion pharaonis TaxID=158019 RepID=A0A812DXA3_ACAPH|nr:unnamed protein product [Sepia pharaonis]